MLIIAIRSGYSQPVCTSPPAERLQVSPSSVVGKVKPY
jgi:hypothetical protein